MSTVEEVAHDRRNVVAALVLVAAGLLGILLAGVDLVALFTVGSLERALRQATPIALAAIGGLYAEKSGVFNIGLEGFMIFGAVLGAVFASRFASGAITQTNLWFGLIAAVILVGVLTVIYAVLTIKFEADQIVAGLAVWFIALGLGPFIAIEVWGDVNSPTLATINDVAIPGLAEIPVLGPLFFQGSPLVLLTIVISVLAWVVLFRTRWGFWIQAAGENPEALDTAGVDVNRVRYATVIFSGVMAGLAGATLSVAFNPGFTGTGVTMVDGRGWIAIVAYLFANYNPVGALGAAFLFGFADMMQIQAQTIGLQIPGALTELFPYVAVIVVLVLIGYTRMPAAVGESYDTEQ